ncbi:MAG TPA: hypothetical protein VF503_23405 [Sphingobium sp.]|uniref:hypothetical protein n=1 Tax=Sphingobium sp. TaxID=1912891 RepID=UPI002ED437EA
MTAEQDLTPPPPSRRGIGTRMILGLLLLAFIGGALLMAWLSQNWRTLGRGQQVISAAPNSAELLQNSSGGADSSTVPPAGGLISPTLVDAQAARIVELEQRLGRISLAAQAASYNANRAEALLTAFAARRALDAGRPLGYIEGTLRLRFGDAQPKAVATIINAAAEPVTLADLRLGLLDIDAVVRDQRSGGSWWENFWREVGSLAILRRTGTPSPEPEQRLDRARHAVELGQIDNAIAEMSALPPQSSVTRWLELARRYNEAHRALDVIEAAAILEPRSTPGIAPAPTMVPDADSPADNAVVPEAAPAKAKE